MGVISEPTLNLEFKENLFTNFKDNPQRKIKIIQLHYEVVSKF